jgi:hypothetical protein
VSRGSGRWPPHGRVFAPRLGDYLARLEQATLASLFARPAALGRALRRASQLLALEVECLDVPAAWILHAAGWPATVGDHGVQLGGAPAKLRPPAETAGAGPLFAVREALRALPPPPSAPATLIALPSPVTLARLAPAVDPAWARDTLQALVRSLGELDLLAGAMLDGDDGVTALGRMLDHHQLAAICIRRWDDPRPAPPGALLARALSIDAFCDGASAANLPAETLVTTDGPVAPDVPPETLLQASRAFVASCGHHR